MRERLARPLRRSIAFTRRAEVVRVWLPAVCLLTLLIGGMSVLLLRGQNQSLVALEERYELRAALASRFVASYVRDVQAREAAHAAELLSQPTVMPWRFSLVSRGFGFDAAVLLDSRGRVLNLTPPKPELLGVPLAGRYLHLSTAVAGRAAVSDIVPSAARAEPIVAFAVPFETPQGRRVFSGGLTVAKSPLRAFLANAMPLGDARTYVLDSSGRLIVAGGSDHARLRKPPVTNASNGGVTLGGVEYRYAVHAVAGTPWTLVAVASSRQLFAPLRGPSRWIPWGVLIAFAAASAAALGLLGKLLRGKAELAHLASHDPLTGTVNRRSLETAFQRLKTGASSRDLQVGVLMIDLDYFKNVNDIHGHAAGDELLRQVARTLRRAVRPSDIVARTGGDEFAILLADVNQEQLVEVAQRVVTSLDEALVRTDGVVLRQRCSVGIALAEPEDLIDIALARADRALYEAKARGRNGWHAVAAT